MLITADLLCVYFTAQFWQRSEARPVDTGAPAWGAGRQTGSGGGLREMLVPTRHKSKHIGVGHKNASSALIVNRQDLRCEGLDFVSFVFHLHYFHLGAKKILVSPLLAASYKKKIK